jgi:hypothetical protein
MWFVRAKVNHLSGERSLCCAIIILTFHAMQRCSFPTVLIYLTNTPCRTTDETFYDMNNS